MARRRKLYEGKAKILFEGPEPGTRETEGWFELVRAVGIKAD